MEYYQNILCVTLRDMIADTEIISKNTFLVNVRRKNITCVRRGGGEGCEALYAWDSIPAKYKVKFIEKYGDPEATMKKEMVQKTLRLDSKARAYYEGYTYEDVSGAIQHLSDKLIGEYTTNASVLATLLYKQSECKALRASLGITMNGVWDIVQQSCENMRESYEHTLPANIARLKAKLKAFKQDGYASLISGKVGNNNTLKITDEYRDMLVGLKRSRVPVYTDRQLFERAGEIAEEYGWKPIRSLSGLKKWFNSAEIQPLWWDAVHGEQSARQRFSRKHKTALPTLRDSLWYGDGTKLNLYYRDDFGNVRTTCVYEIIDAMSEVMLGYHISDSEDYEAQYHAIRMAVQVSGHKPYEFVHDNQGGHKKLDNSGLFSSVATIHRPTMPYNGESKTIESIFGRFQAQVLHKDWRFTGQNVSATKASSRPNVEFISENKDNLYTLNELKAAYAAARKEWNEMAHPATGQRRIDMYNNSVNEQTQEVTLYDMIDMFWVFTPKPVTFTDQGIQITVKGKKYPYEVYDEAGMPDHAWRRQHTYDRFIVAYDPYDMASVRLYKQEADGSKRFVRIAQPYLVIHRAQQEQTAVDKALIRAEQQANLQDRIERQVAARAIEHEQGVAPEQHGLRAARIKGVNKHVHEEIEQEVARRVRRYKQPADSLELGKYTKSISMDDWQHELEDTEEVMIPVAVSPRKIAGKM